MVNRSAEEWRREVRRRVETPVRPHRTARRRRIASIVRGRVVFKKDGTQVDASLALSLGGQRSSSSACISHEANGVHPRKLNLTGTISAPESSGI